MNNYQDLMSRRVEDVTRSALAAGVLAPIKTQSRIVPALGVPMELRYLDALAKKDVERAISGDRPAHRQGPFNPFLPYDPALFVADVEPGHVIILNKFPAVAHHVLLISREFVDQEAVVSCADFVAVATMMATLEGVIFFNAGKTAGGSQPHRHFQLIPETLPIEAVLPARTVTRPQALTTLPFRHAFVHHRFDPQCDPEANAAPLFELFRACCAAVDVVERDGHLSPYNLLLTRQWMMVIPRTRECWEYDGQSISINALGFGGHMLLRSTALIDAVAQQGIFKVLAAVTQ